MRQNTFPPTTCWHTALAAYWSSLAGRAQGAASPSEAPDPILTGLADQLRQCLVEPALPAEAARHVGQRLATVARDEPDLLGATHHWLVINLLEPTSPWAATVEMRRLLAVLAALAVGFAEGWRGVTSPKQREAQEYLIHAHHLIVQHNRQDRACLAAIVDTIAELVLALDAHGRITVFNRACEQLTGYSATEVVGTYLWERFLHLTDSLRVITLFHTGQLAQIPLSYTTSWTTRTGETRWIFWSTRVLDAADGPATRVVCTGIALADHDQPPNSAWLVQPHLVTPPPSVETQPALSSPVPADTVAVPPPDKLVAPALTRNPTHAIPAARQELHRTAHETLPPPPSEPVPQPTVPELAALTPREREILALVAQGYENAKIAGLLSISAGTVKNHVLNFTAKLGVRSRAEAIAWAWRTGLSRPE